MIIRYRNHIPVNWVQPSLGWAGNTDMANGLVYSDSQAVRVESWWKRPFSGVLLKSDNMEVCIPDDIKKKTIPIDVSI